jgi:hypothetical protein
MAGTLKRLGGPASLTATAANLYNPATNLYGEIRHIHLNNATGSSKTVDVFIGATTGSAAATALFNDLSIAANTPYDYYCLTRMATTDFLTGLASVASDSVQYVVEGYEYAA